ncbi:multiple epidermal growth factor-like domains protein 10, partial [Haliotis cracherodii]|uniref:multiple epidermal growth factor-like domains protein 10 n=1 Tax=Haliotis cracherodii TaxID=6455 RepID=UPI0039ED4F16
VSIFRHVIPPFAIVCLALIVLSIREIPCENGQHCRGCDRDGDCSTQCERGYFGRKCWSECSSRCTHKSCHLTAIGIETCTEGCVPGFQGTSCKIPCGNPGKQCTECEGGCDGGYCMTPTSCVSECVDSYYGLDCKNCSESCKSCNRSTGICDYCHDPYRGLNCEMSCENCLGSCVSGCEGGCKAGSYGLWCDEVCSENCRPGPDRDAVSILECDTNTTFNCIPKCDKTGDCIHGCNVGWYGTNCSSRCSSRCANMSCDEYGACADGCAPGYNGTDCSCYENCIDHVCYNESGTCANGCINGYYGGFCNATCEICLDGICDQKFGTCIREGNFTDSTCKSTCTHDCPLDVCLSGSSCKEPTPESLKVTIIGTAVACMICLAGIIVAICIGYLERCYVKWKETDDEEEECPVEQLEVRHYELMDFDPDKNETGPVIVFL